MRSKYKIASERTSVEVNDNFSDEDVFVAESQHLIKKGLQGRGLYANRTYQAGDVIGEYVGKILTPEEADAKQSHKQYMFEVWVQRHLVFVIDSAVNRYSSAMKFTNAADTIKQQNAEFKQYDQHIYLVAIKKSKETLKFCLGMASVHINSYHRIL